MANIKINDLVAYTDPVSTDVLAIVDVGNDLTKKVSIADLLENAGTGSAAAPSFSFDGDNNTGIYRPAADQVALTAGGTQALLAESTGITIPGNLTVSGTTTTIDTTTLVVEDKNIEIGKVSTPSNTTADGGGITLKGASDKTITWVNSTGAWTFNQPTNFNDHVRIDSSGRVLVGTSSALTGSNSANGILTIKGYPGGATSAAIFNLARGLNSASVSSGHTLGRIVFADQQAGEYALIEGECDGTPGTNDYPGRLVFSTTADGASSPTERMRIDSSGNVGVGTTSVSNALHVYKNATQGGIGAVTTANATLRLQDSSTSLYLDGNSIYTDGAGRLDIGTIQSTDLAFGTNNTERLRIDSSGNVGIGTTSPADLLEIKGSFPKFSIVDSDTTNDKFSILHNGGGTIFQVDGNNVGPNSSFLITQIDGTERMRIDSSGRVGIGTDSPGSFSSGANTLVVGTESGNAGITINNGAADQIGSIFFAEGTGATAPGRIRYEHANNAMAFSTINSERMRIDSSGNLGLGTTSPIAFGPTLQVAGSDPAFLLQDTATAVDYFGTNIAAGLVTNWYDDAAAWRIGTASGLAGSGYSEKLRIDSSGNMGLGKSSNLFYRLTFQEGAGDANRIGWVSNSGNRKASIDCGNTAAIVFNTGTGDTERMRILSDGTIATGGLTATPGTVAAGSYIQHAANAGFFGNNGDAKFGSSANNPVLFQVNGSEKARIDSSGRVGIGNTAMGSLTDNDANDLVVGTGAANAGITVYTGTGNYGSLTFADGTSGDAQYRGYITYHHNGDSMRFTTAGSERMRIDNSGRVGIGNSDPGTMLHVSDSTDDGTFRVGGDNAGNTGFNVLYENGGTTYTILKQNYATTNANAYTSIHTGYFTVNTGTSLAERMRIDNSGHTMFGTSSSSITSGVGVKIIANSEAPSVNIVFNSSNPNQTFFHLYNTNSTYNAYRFYVGAHGGIYNFSSNNSNLCDEREKKNIIDVENKWDKVKSWEIKKFHYNDDADTDDLRYGVIAQQVETQCPEVLTEWVKQKAEDAVLDEDGNVVTPAKEQILRKGVKEQQMMWMAIKALQESMAKIETLEQRLSDAGIA